MKPVHGSMLGVLGCVFLLAAGCGGSSFTGSDGQGGSGAGTASGGSGTAGASGSSTSGGSVSGGETSGGNSSGGTDSGGMSTGGTDSSGGTDSGGSSTGGTDSGGGVTGGGTSSGGTGGATTACEMDTDCIDCRYPKAPAAKADCYCANCANTPMSKTACAANTTDYETVCKDVHLPCPAIACVLPPTPKCKSHMCVAG